MIATFLTPVLAAALIVLAELAFGPLRLERRALARLGAVALGAAVAAVAVLLAATIAAGRSIALTAAGMAAAVAVVGLLRVLLGRAG